MLAGTREAFTQASANRTFLPVNSTPSLSKGTAGSQLGPCRSPPDESTSKPAFWGPPGASSSGNTHPAQHLRGKPSKQQPPVGPQPVPPPQHPHGCRHAEPLPRQQRAPLSGSGFNRCHPRGGLDTQQNWQRQRDPGGGEETNNRRNQPPRKTMRLFEAGVKPIVPAAGLDLG